MARIIALANQKGGVAKTSSTINLGAALVELGRRVLLVDLDQQMSLTAALGINPASLSGSICDVLRHTMPMPDIIVPAGDLQLAPATTELADVEIELLSMARREHVLAEALADVTDAFDDILIDCPPSLGQLTINALTAADAVLVPTECSFLALRGLNQLITTIARIQQRSNPQLRLLGVLPTMYENRTLHERDALEDLQRRFPHQVFTPIPRSVRFRDSTVAGVPMLTFDSAHPGALAYRKLAREVI